MEISNHQIVPTFCQHTIQAYSLFYHPSLESCCPSKPPPSRVTCMFHWACSPLLQQTKELIFVLWVMAGMEKWTADPFSLVQPSALHLCSGTPNKHATLIPNSFTLLCKQSLNKNLSFVLPSKSPCENLEIWKSPWLRIHGTYTCELL